ncbi:MAG: class I SAM-dependent methyltransferase [Myxococcales bacterium]|nr:class I SAM-dependent methyltransferase [Myxococcota bacterium]MDW8281238.1 class I SAM-dependent methyltransferase [Myxococcales bacterium]
MIDIQTELGQKTIRDFEIQWSKFPQNRDYYGSLSLFEDIIEPLVSVREFVGARVADIGSGTGRIVRMLAQAGCASILAVEPANLGAIIRRNTQEFADRISYLQATGDQLPPTGDLDFVVSIGVLHHIPDPLPVVRAAYHALRPGGRLLVWLYGREGNELYLRLVQPLRRVTHRLPHAALWALAGVLSVPLEGYLMLCRHLQLPMRAYMLGHLGRLSPAERRLTIYDQLRPAWARYYTRQEAEDLLREGGFVDVRSHHRHGYSWTVLGTRPG